MLTARNGVAGLSALDYLLILIIKFLKSFMQELSSNFTVSFVTFINSKIIFLRVYTSYIRLKLILEESIRKYLLTNLTSPSTSPF